MIEPIRNSVHFGYSLSDPISLDNLLSVATKARNAQDAVRKAYRSDVTCDVRLSEHATLSEDYPFISVQLEGIWDLEPAIREYILHAGVPQYVENGPNIDMVNNVLAEYGKTTNPRVRFLNTRKFAVEDLPLRKRRAYFPKFSR